MLVGSLNALFLATVVFVGGHFLLSSLPVRKVIVNRIGDGGFRGLYTIVAGASFVWMLFAYGAAPYAEVWVPPPVLHWVPALLMPIVLFLAVAGVTTQGATAVGGEKVLAEEVHDLSPGVLRITRHPFLWSAALWALCHLCVNGDAASVVLMGGILVLAIGGMLHIDQRREATMESAWGPFAMTTSLVPFAAILSGRTTFDWSGIGLWRVALALVLYAALLHFHSWIFGVSALPA